MRGMVGGWCPAGIGGAVPRAVDGVAGDRPGGVWLADFGNNYFDYFELCSDGARNYPFW